MRANNGGWQDASRLTAVVGHFGSGKTEFSLNLALHIADQGHPTALADLDIVDPYFRSRECEAELAERGVKLIMSSPNSRDADIPSMPAEVRTLFDNDVLYGVLDIGGDASGARVLARYRHYLQKDGARLLCVVNANRPLTDTAENALTYLRQIEAASGMRIDGIVNNTHLCAQTEVRDILAGAELARRLSEASGIPVVCHAVPDRLANSIPPLPEPVFPIRLFMKKPWE